MELTELLCFVVGRLTQRGRDKRAIQIATNKIYNNAIKEVNSLEEKINKEIQNSFNETEERVLTLIKNLNIKEEEDNESDLKSYIEQAEGELLCDQKYDIEYTESAKCFEDAYRLSISITRIEKKIKLDKLVTDDNDDAAVCVVKIRKNKERIVNQLQTYLNEIRESMQSTQNKLTEICTKRRNEAEKFQKRIIRKMESLFSEEDSKINKFVTMINSSVGNGKYEELKELALSEKIIFFTNKKPVFINTSKGGYSFDGYDVITEDDVPLKYVGSRNKRFSNFTISLTDKGNFSIYFTIFNDEEMKILKSSGIPVNIEITIWKKGGSHFTPKSIFKAWDFNKTNIVNSSEVLEPKTTYCLKMRIEQSGVHTVWSDTLELTTLDFKECCVWRDCPLSVEEGRRYLVDENNPRIATSTHEDSSCTITGSITIPSGRTSSWSIKLLKSRDNNGDGIYIGVAPFDVDQNADVNRGWYVDLWNLTLLSGPPHNYRDKKYGIRKGGVEEGGNYIHEGEIASIGVDTIKGSISFILNGTSQGIAYEGVPLDKPLVPCVLIGYKGDSVELVLTELDIQLDYSIPVPSNVTALRNELMWEHVTLTWDDDKSATFYQVEVDGDDKLYLTTKNTFTKDDFKPYIEHSFRVRSVKGILMSEWSSTAHEKTYKTPDFSKCTWKECDDFVDGRRKYSVEAGFKIATKNIDDYYAITGNIFFPINKVTRWGVKILYSKWNDGGDIYVGIAPFDINQNDADNYIKCGWYLYCFDSTLRSGPPHNYNQDSHKECGERKGKGRKYIYTGSTVGLIVDTIDAKLTFITDNTNHGVAYEGIPLDKPLVPCVILKYEGDSVELLIE